VSPRSDSDAVDDIVRQYLREIGAHALLTSADEVTLASAIEAGRDAQAALDSTAAADLSPASRRQLRRAVATGREARRQFIVANLRLVVNIAKRYQHSGLPLLDLVQEGNLGLIRAVEKFDHHRGYKFSTYATWWIRQAIGRAIAEKGRTIRLPARVGDAAARVIRARASLRSRLGRDPSIEEIAADAGMSVEAVRASEHVVADAVSLHATRGQDRELIDVVEDPDAQNGFAAADDEGVRANLRAVLDTLHERERAVLYLRFGLDGDEPQTLEQLGERFALTRERIRQIEAKAMTKMRHPAMPTNIRQLHELARHRASARATAALADSGAAAAN